MFGGVAGDTGALRALGVALELSWPVRPNSQSPS